MTTLVDSDELRGALLRYAEKLILAKEYRNANNLLDDLGFNKVGKHEFIRKVKGEDDEVRSSVGVDL